MRTKEKNAISLIVLVITILVLTILASTVIISLSGTNIINETSKAVLKSNLATMQDMATVYLVDNYETIDMEKEYLITEFGITDDEFKDYRDFAFVKAGRVHIKTNAPEEIQEVAKELNMLTKEVVSSNTGSIAVDKIVTGLKIYGNTESTVSVGELVSDETDSNYGKYKIPVKVVGKNLAEKRMDIDSSGASVTTTVLKEVDASKNINTSLIEVEPGKSYALSRTIGSGNFRYFWYDTIPVYMSTYSIGGAYLTYSKLSETVTAPDTAKYLFVKWSEGIDAGDIQIEEGSVATEISRGPTTYNIYLDEPLRKLEDVADYIDCTTGEVVRYIGVNDAGELKMLSAPVKESVTLEEMNFEGTKNIYVNTTIVPSKIEVEY